MKRVIFALATVAMAVTVANANPNMGTETSQSKSSNTDRGMSLRDTDEQGKSKSNRTSTIKSTGIDKQLQDSARSSVQSQSSSSADVTLPLESLFQSQILALEKSLTPEETADLERRMGTRFQDFWDAKNVFVKCQLLSHPKLPKDYGITALLNEFGTVIDTNKAQMLSSLAASNGPVSAIADEEMLTLTRQCMALYGAYLGQAYLNVEGYIATLSESPDVKPEVVTVQPVKKGGKKSRRSKRAKRKEHGAEVIPTFTVNIKALPDGGSKRIVGIGIDDYIALETEALIKALTEGVRDVRIRTLVNQALNDSESCNFAGSTDKILCGSSYITLAPQQQLETAGVVVFGKSFAGFNGSYRLSKNSSLSEAYEKLLSNSKNSKESRDVSAAIEKMEREGHAFEASMAKRTSVQKGFSDRDTIDISAGLQGAKAQ